MRLRAVFGDQRGVTLVVVLAFLVLVVPATTAALSFAATVSTDSKARTQGTLGHYSTTGGAEHAFYRIVHEPGYVDGLALDIPDIYTVALNGRTVSVAVTKLSAVATAPPESTYNSNQRLRAEKVVTPTTAVAGVLTTFTYTVMVTNGDDTSKSINQIVDELPSGFTYVAASTSGLTSLDPAISGRELTWDVASMQIDLAPGELVSLTFDAQASVAEGVYCNEAWVRPGDQNTSSGKTAGVTVGSPATSVCDGTAVVITKTVSPASVIAGALTTYAYTVVIDNIGAVDINVSNVRDLLPVGFLYVLGSTTGDLTGQEPSTMFQQGRERLDWGLSPAVQVPSGESRTLVLEAEAAVPPGRYWNEAWVTVDEFPDPVPTGPTAPVSVLGPISIVSSDQTATTTALVWVSDTSFELTGWELDG